MTTSEEKEVTEEVVAEQVNVSPIINQDSKGNKYRYFKVQNGEYADVTFTITEIDFVKTSDLSEKEQANTEDETTARGRVLFEDTAAFTSRDLLNAQGFGAIVRDVFDSIVNEIKTAMNDTVEVVDETKSPEAVSETENPVAVKEEAQEDE